MFRGFDLYDGNSIQPSLGATYDTGYGKIGGSMWMQLSADNHTQVDRFTEIDYTLSYSYAWELATVKVGHLWYTYPVGSDEIDDSDEFFATVVFDDSKLGSPFTLSPTFSVYHDYNLATGQYYELALSHTITSESLGENFNVTPYVAFGFAAHEDTLYADDGFVQSTVGALSDVQLGIIKLTPTVNYTFKADDNTVNKFWFGFTLAASL